MTTNEWSIIGLLTSETKVNGSKTEVKKWYYDESGFMTGASDGSVITRVNEKDAKYVPNAWDLPITYETSVGGKSMAVSGSFDKGLRATSTTYPDGTSATYGYDSLGSLKEIPGYAKNGTYNFMGRLVSLEATNGTKRTKTWDPVKGTLTGYEWGVTGKTARTIGWDLRGNITSLEKDGNKSTFSYDGLNRLFSEYDAGPVETNTKDTGVGIWGAREGDVAGRKPLETRETASLIKFDYNATSVGINLINPQKINKIRLNDVSARITDRTVELYVSASGAAGEWALVPNVTFIPDSSGVTLRLTEPVEAKFVKLHSTWDERDSEYGVIDAHTIASPLGDLIEVWYTVNGQQVNWTFDSLGNRITESRIRGTLKNTQYTYYQNTNRLKSNGQWYFNYDANGNLVARGTDATWNSTTLRYDFSLSSGELYRYGYDLSNRLVSVERSASGTDGLALLVRYTYDIRSLRVMTDRNGAKSWTQFDPAGDIIWKEDESGTIKYVQALDQTWAEVRTDDTGNHTYFHHLDHVGTTEAITDSTGYLVWDASFDAYGNTLRQNGSITFTPSYTGRELDIDTGLYYLNARWYDPELGRFITEDPIRDGENWYGYVRNNPLRYVDPTGLEPTLDWLHEEGLIPDEDFAKYNTRPNGPLQKIAAFVMSAAPGSGDVGDIAGVALGKDIYTGEDLSAGDRVLTAVAAALPVVSGPMLRKGAKVLAKIIPDGLNVFRKADNAVEAVEKISADLHRPYIRNGTRDAVESAAPRTVDGLFIDPNTGKAIEGSYDLGHKPGNEFWREKAKAQQEGLTQKQFNDRMNNPDYYQIEDPFSNRGHKFELPK